MAQVMEQGCRIEDAPMLFQGHVLRQQSRKGLTCDVKDAKGVSEAAGFSPMEG